MAALQYVRAAIKKDVPIILKFIKDLAAYEKAIEHCKITQKDLNDSLFPANSNPAVFAHIAIDVDEVVGIAIWHLNYSTWTGKHGIYLEDLYVDPKYRGKGHGKNLLKQLAIICQEKGYERLQWWCLKWNEPSIKFYETIGAKPQDEWTVFRVDGEHLNSLSSMKIIQNDDKVNSNKKRSREEKVTPTSIVKDETKIKSKKVETIKSPKNDLLQSKNEGTSEKKRTPKDIEITTVTETTREKRESKPPSLFKAGHGLQPL